MGLFQTIKKTFLDRKQTETPTLLTLPINKSIQEKFVAKIETEHSWTEKDLEQHPTDLEFLEKTYLNEPLVFGAINKTVDFVVGPGFRVTSKDKRIETLLNTQIKNLNFDTLLKNVAKDMLIYGNSYVEIDQEGNKISALRTLSPKYIFVKRNEFGELLGYKQKMGIIKQSTELSTKQIIHFAHNKIGDKAYGISPISTILPFLQIKRNIEQDTAEILRKKAGAMAVYKLGEEGNRANNTELANFRSQLEGQRNNQDLVTGHHLDVIVPDFAGKMIDTTPFVNHLQEQILSALEVPLVIMGKANIPEGLASAQLETFERRIVSIQQSIEQVLETELFKKILEINGLAGDAEFDWESPTKKDRLTEATQLTTMMQLALNGIITEKTLVDMEMRLRELLGFDEIPINSELEREEELTEPQPALPERNEQLHENLLSIYDETHLKEFVGFNYDEYLNKIVEFINSEEFEQRKYKGFEYVPGTNQQDWIERIITYKLKDNLSQEQINTLRDILIDNFRKGTNIRTINKQIINRVQPGDLEIRTPTIRDNNGKIIRKSFTRTIPERIRSLQMARTEVIRASNEGAIKVYKSEGVKKVRWVAAISDRTCAYCAAQNGQLFSIEEGQARIVPHSSCRCRLVSVD